MREDRQRGDGVGHVRRLAVVAEAALDLGRFTGADEKIEDGAAQRTFAGALGVWREGAACGGAVIDFRQGRFDLAPDGGAKRLVGLAHCVGIDVAGKLAGDVGLARQFEELGAIGGGERSLGGGGAEGLGKPDGLSSRDRLLVATVTRCRGQEVRGVALRRLPAVERIGVVHHQELDLVRIEADVETDRRGEVAKQRWGGCRRNVGEGEGLLAAGDLDQAVAERRAAGKLERQVVAVAAEQSKLERDRHRLFAGLAWRGRHDLIDGQPCLLRPRVVVERAGELRRAGLVVPEHELGEVASRSVGHGGDEILDRRRLAVMALEVEVEAFAESLAAEQGLQHAAELGALLVDGRRVEVVDLDIGGGPHGMGEGARVLGELARS